MTVDEFRDFLQAEPFCPFLIHMASGRRIGVDDPGQIAHGGGRIAVMVRPDDTIEVIHLEHIVSLEAKPIGTV